MHVTQPYLFYLYINIILINYSDGSFTHRAVSSTVSTYVCVQDERETLIRGK